MHWIDRGPEPSTLQVLKRRYTSGWVEYFLHKRGVMPRDSRWRDYWPNMRQIFHGLCAYCEALCRGEVDHFRPKSVYPQLVHSWSNWLFACHDCNHSKRQQWPECGYVDPCAVPWPGSTDAYFRFDLRTGEILPKENLPAASKQKAQTTISALGLNHLHHLEARIEWLMIIEAVIMNEFGEVDYEGRKHIAYFASRTSRYSSLSRAWLSKQGIAYD